MYEDEESGMKQIILWVLIVTFVLTIFVSGWLVAAIAINDYGIYELQTVVEDFHTDGYLDDAALNASDDLGEAFQEWIYAADKVFIVIYVFILLQSLMYAYFSRGMDYFSFFGFLFYGSMIILFILSLILNVSRWILDNFLLKLIPSAFQIVPGFAWFIEWAGIILFVHLALCVFVNKVDLDLVKNRLRKQKEQSVLKGGEL